MNRKSFDYLYEICITLFFLLTLNSLEGNKSKPIKKGCFNAPIYVYDEELKKYYRQDWCKTSKEPVYFDSIPVPSNGERGENVLLS